MVSAPELISCARAFPRLPPPAHCACLRPYPFAKPAEGRIRFMPVCCAPARAAAQRAGCIIDPRPGGAGSAGNAKSAADGRQPQPLWHQGHQRLARQNHRNHHHRAINGVKQKVKAAFRVYDSHFEHALADYAKLLTNNPRYRGVGTSQFTGAGRKRCRQGLCDRPGLRQKAHHHYSRK